VQPLDKGHKKVKFYKIDFTLKKHLSYKGHFGLKFLDLPRFYVLLEIINL